MSAPVPPSRRGWCPGTRRPMQTGDGLLARIHPFGGIVSRDQALALADLAEECGNGLLDVTARGNLQIRGVSEETYPVLIEALSDLGLAEPDGPGPHRLTMVSPLAGIDPQESFDSLALAGAIEAACAGVTGLPPKSFVAVDGGGRFALPPGADLRIEPAEGGARVLLARGDGYVATPAMSLAEVPEAVAGMLERFVVLPSLPGGLLSFSSGEGGFGREQRPETDGDFRPEGSKGSWASPYVRRSTTTPLRACGANDPIRPAGFAVGPPSPEGKESEEQSSPGPHPTPPLCSVPTSPAGRDKGVRLRDVSDEARAFIAKAVISDADGDPGSPSASEMTTEDESLLLPLPFGRTTASALRFVATCAPGDIRLSFTRAILVPHLTTREREHLLREARKHGFVVDPADPRLAVEACPGAPACRSGRAAAAGDASGIARAASHLLREGLSLHVSGCAKGCARPRPADLTLVAIDEATYGLVLGGGAGDKPVRIMTRAALEQTLARVARREDLASGIGE